MSRAFSLSVEASLEKLKRIRSFINESGRSLHVDDETLGELCLVVDEAVTNIIVHGYAGEPGPVDIDVSAEQDDLVIRIRDRARAFEASGIESPRLDESLSERAYGGMGVYLIRKLTDEAEFGRLPGGGNELRLVKRGAVGK